MKATKLKGFLSPLLRDIRINQVSKFIVDNRVVLDLGCDDATLLKYIAPKHYTGVDNNKEQIRINDIHHLKETWVDFRYANLNERFSSDKLYDFVVMSAIIEHLSNIKEVLKDIYAITTPKAKIIITTPIKKSDFLLKIGAKFGIFAKESLNEHEKYYSKNDFLNLDGWRMIEYKKFEFGLNQLIVLERIQ